MIAASAAAAAARLAVACPHPLRFALSRSDDDRGSERPFPAAAARPRAWDPAPRPLSAGGAAAAGPQGPRLAGASGARVRGGGGGDRAHAVGRTREDATPRAPWVPATTAVFEGGLFIRSSLWKSNGCPWDTTTACAAAGGGYLDVVKWLHNHGCPWDHRTCAYAAPSGHMRVMQWAREHHCPWSWMTTAWAAEGGHQAVLQWARENDCPWDSHTCLCAATTGQLEVLQWVRVNDTTVEVWNEDDVRRCAWGPREQEVLTWLDQHSVP